MPIIEPVNTQQVIQMGSHVEKVQQTIQQQQGVLTKQLEIESNEIEDVKRRQVQETEDSYQSDASNPDDKGKNGRLRLKSDGTFAVEESKQDDEEPFPAIVEENYGGRINIWV